MYFGLEGTGPRIWALLEEPRSVQQVCDNLMQEYDIDADACRIEVCKFLEELRRAQLVRIHDNAPDAARPPSGS
ncbi:MAG: PqqD family peptide modification chaperone [Gemmatimonadaceae bacterium]